MSLTAIFTRAPRRAAAVGPSIESNQTISYKNPGISLQVFDTNTEIGKFQTIVGVSRVAAAKDTWMLSYANVISAVPVPNLIVSYADASANLTYDEGSVSASQKVPVFDVTQARALVYPTAKPKLSVSIEV